jgi:Amidohydrolase ring-opening protein (Amido_AtzD_TrzD)
MTCSTSCASWPRGVANGIWSAIGDAGLDLPPRPHWSDLGGRLVNVFLKCEASQDGAVRGRRNVMLDDSDVHWHRQIKSCVGGVAAAVTGDPAVSSRSPPPIRDLRVADRSRLSSTSGRNLRLATHGAAMSDIGSADRRVAAALAGYAAGTDGPDAVMAALAQSRLLVPVVAVLDEAGTALAVRASTSLRTWRPSRRRAWTAGAGCSHSRSRIAPTMAT